MIQERELTLRALLTGLLLGAALTPCNVYAGLKIGWSFNMSIIALLVGFGFWRTLSATRGTPEWTRKESNISQTTASSAASIISGGLVAPIPAHALITGDPMTVGPMMAWVFAVSFLGIWVAWYLRPMLVVRSALRFPAGMATLETLDDIFGHGREAIRRIVVLAAAGALSASAKAINDFVFALPRWSPSALWVKFTFTLEPSLLLVGFGGIIGLRVGLSLLAGAVVAWAGLAPWLLEVGWIVVPETDAGSLFGPLVEWLLWPGVALMVGASLTSFAIQLGRALQSRAGSTRTPASEATLSWRWPPVAGFALATVLTVMLQVLLFDISLWLAILAVPFAVLLATVAARVVGDTGIPPIGAIGKVSQLGFGVLAPGQAIANLMPANVAGGAAGQCADLLNDFRTGHGIGASPDRQVIAQCLGVLTGSVIGVLVYLALIPDPALLLTETWPAPAVATWKAVAETLAVGWSAVPQGAGPAMLIGTLVGMFIAIAEGVLPPARRRCLPSAVALGLAFVIPASISIMMCLGAVLVALLARWRPAWATRYAIAASAGLIAGESLTGVFSALLSMVH
ncbi:OPT family oligopeptide transporter [Nitrogeniibacter aestuarii]|uniref:OPT family oligopeptide transporter n=1 Tax=Nitrogeniibacter aestuarii TaxID=2815343 RepID=UPI001D0F543A|nr:OPT family oligopeptide transporter [Nitrogeniibacter aestuarii]